MPKKQIRLPKLPEKITIDFQTMLIGIIVVLSFTTTYYYNQTQILSNKSTSKDSGVVAADSAAPTAKPTNADYTSEVTGIKQATSDDHVQGNLDKAEVILVSYTDYECPYCKNWHKTMEQVITAYGDRVAWVYKHTPLSFHANAQKEAEASECVAELGGNTKFWNFVDSIFAKTTSNGTGIALTALPGMAKDAGVDEAKFTSCLDSGKYADKVSENTTEGAALGVSGTPGTIVYKKGSSTGKLIPGALPLASVKTIIDNIAK